MLALLSVGLIQANAQHLKQTGREVNDLVPEGWTVYEARGDLFHHGRSDLVLITVPNYQTGVTVRHDGYVINSNTPVLAIYSMSEDGKFIKHCEHNNVIPPLQDDNFSTELELKVTDRRTLSIMMNTFFSAGGYGSPRHKYIFRYQNGGFYLIGEDSEFFSRNTGEGEAVSTNYLTNRQSVSTFNVFEETTQKPDTRWKKIVRKPLRRLGSFTLEY